MTTDLYKKLADDLINNDDLIHPVTSGLDYINKYYGKTYTRPTTATQQATQAHPYLNTEQVSTLQQASNTHRYWAEQATQGKAPEGYGDEVWNTEWADYYDYLVQGGDDLSKVVEARDIHQAWVDEMSRGNDPGNIGTIEEQQASVDFYNSILKAGGYEETQPSQAAQTMAQYLQSPASGIGMLSRALPAAEKVIEPLTEWQTKPTAAVFTTPQWYLSKSKEERQGIAQRYAEEVVPLIEQLQDKPSLQNLFNLWVGVKFKPYQEGGSLREEYEKLPEGEKIAVEIASDLPLYISGGVAAGTAKAAITGTGTASKVARGTLTVLGAIESKPPTTTGFPGISEMVAAQHDSSKVSALISKLKVGALNPMSKAKTDPEKAAIAWRTLHDDMSPSFASLDMDGVLIRSQPFKVSGEGLVGNISRKTGTGKVYIQEVLEFPDRFVLSETQRAEVDAIEAILMGQFEKETAAGVAVKATKLKPGQRYFPRFVKEIRDLETQALQEIKKAGGRRPGVKPGSFRDRYYQEVLDGIKAGKVYTNDYRAALEMRLTAGNKAIADKMWTDYLAPLGKTPSEKVAPKILTAAKEAQAQSKGITRFIEVANRALRGEKIPTATLKAQENKFPELGAELRNALGDKTKLRTVLNKAKQLAPSLKEASAKAKGARTVAMRKARTPILGKEGSINLAGLNGKIFPIEISEPSNAMIRASTESSRVLEQMARVNALARMGQTAVDQGFMMLQVQMTLFDNPRAWARAFVNTFKTLKNPANTRRWFAGHRNTRDFITQSGGAPFTGTEFTEATRTGGLLSKPSKILKIPQRFAQAFDDAINTARIMQTESKKAIQELKLGHEIKPASREATELVTTVDNMVGLSSLTRLGVSRFTEQIMRNVLYAPRYYGAFVNLVVSAFKGGVAGDIARQALAKYTIGTASFMTALAYATGQGDKVTSGKIFNPTKSDFMTVEIGGVHVGLGGPYIAAARLLSGMITAAEDDPSKFASTDPHDNPILRYGYGRSSPVAGAVIDYATGENYLGQTLRTPMDYLEEFITKTFPFWASDVLADTIREGEFPKGGWQKGLAEWWGLRSWLVTYREKAKEYANEQIKNIPEDMVMDWQKGIDLTYDDLNNEQRAWLLEQYADYKELKDKADEESLRFESDYGYAKELATEELETAYQSDLRDLANYVLSGETSIPDYIDQSSYLRDARYDGTVILGMIEQKMPDEDTESLEKWLEENQKPEDKAYEEYGELRANPPKKAGVPDWDAWKENLNEYFESQTPEVQDYILRRRDDWIKSLPEEAQKIERLIFDMENHSLMETYYNIPKEESGQRTSFRESYPEFDAALFILGRVSGLRTDAAFSIVLNYSNQYGVPITPVMSGGKSATSGKTSTSGISGTGSSYLDKWY